MSQHFEREAEMSTIRKLYDAAEGAEKDTLDDIVLRAGYVWLCGFCSGRNDADSDTCDGCGGFRLSGPYSVGDRVRFVKDVDRYPHAYVEAGATGTVSRTDGDCFAVRLDEHNPDLAEWDNAIEWYPTDGEGWSALEPESTEPAPPISAPRPAALNMEED